MKQENLFHKRRVFFVLGVATILLAATVTIVYAAISYVQGDGSINACVLKDGTLYLLASGYSTCKKGETLAQWNVTGPQGDKGDKGDTGADGKSAYDVAVTNGYSGTEDNWLASLVGPKGDKGDTGAAGTNGVDGDEGPAGLACWDLNGNGAQDASEDINLDNQWDTADCKGPQGEKGDTGGTAEVTALQAQVTALQAQVDALLHLQGKTVFITSTVSNGNLGGLIGADSKCQTLATNAGLTGIYKAWLSDSTSSPSTRFTHSKFPYYRVDGLKVADNWADLTDESLDTPITVTEGGTSLGYEYIRTGTNNFGAAVYGNCNNWTSSSMSLYALSGLIGAPGEEQYGWWTDSGLLEPCWSPMRLYCFQQ